MADGTLWIESHVTIRNHKKLLRLMKELGVNRAQAIGHLHMLWWWAAECSANGEPGDGDLSAYPESDIGSACGWTGKPATILRALQTAGFLDGMKIHDWPQYIGKLLTYRAKRRTKSAKDRQEDKAEMPGTVPGTRTGTVPGTVPDAVRAPCCATVPYRTGESQDSTVKVLPKVPLPSAAEPKPKPTPAGAPSSTPTAAPPTQQDKDRQAAEYEKARQEAHNLVFGAPKESPDEDIPF